MITQCPKTGRTCEVTGCDGCWKAEPQITTPDVCGEVCARAKLCYGCNKDLEEANAKYAEQAEQEPVDHIGIKHDAQLVETFLRCPMTGNQLYFASEPIQKKGMNYMRLQDGEGNEWTLIARLDEGWDGK